MLQNVLNMLNVNTYYATLSTGVLLIVVLLLDKLINPISAYQRTDAEDEEALPSEAGEE